MNYQVVNNDNRMDSGATGHCVLWSDSRPWLLVFLSGCTWEFSAMVGYIKKAYPQTQLIVIGFSLGGNIVCKFLGENRNNQERVLCSVSVCQGYSALRWVAARQSSLSSDNHMQSHGA